MRVLRIGHLKLTPMPAGVKGRGAALNQFFLRLHGLWEGIVTIPRPPPPPFDIERLP
jgi:hypothetical protein